MVSLLVVNIDGIIGKQCGLCWYKYTTIQIQIYTNTKKKINCNKKNYKKILIRAINRSQLKVTPKPLVCHSFSTKGKN